MSDEIDEIKNPNTEEDQPDLMTLEDEDGNEITFEVIDALDHKGRALSGCCGIRRDRRGS